MKILYIHEYFTDGMKNGANIVAFTSFNLMKENGHEVYFYSVNQKPYVESQNIEKYFPNSHINQKSLIGNIKYRIYSIFNWKAMKNLAAVLDEIKPDIVHIHSFLELSPSILIPIKKRKIPFVMTIHDAGFVCPVMGTKYMQCTKCNKNVFNCIKNKCSRNNVFNSLYSMFKFMIYKLILKFNEPNAYITPSKILQEYAATTKTQKNINVINNALDESFSDIEPNFNNNGYFLYVGSLHDVKGVNILLDAVKILPEDINFRIAGTGLHEEKYRKFVENNNLKNVKFLGAMNRNELIQEYRSCIATIVPSNCFETFGMINIEAFINGKPVIASNIGGIPEIVEHNVNGQLFEAGNVEQLKECILKYWNNPELVVEHGKNAYQKAINNYTGTQYYKKLIKLYDKTINILKISNL